VELIEKAYLCNGVFDGRPGPICVLLCVCDRCDDCIVVLKVGDVCGVERKPARKRKLLEVSRDEVNERRLHELKPQMKGKRCLMTCVRTWVGHVKERKPC
jgi:hypothetical protein